MANFILFRDDGIDVCLCFEGNESFEKLASMSLIANLTVYLRTKYNLSGIALVNVVTIWAGTSNVSSILGAIVSDVYLGRFLTLLCGTICSLMVRTIISLHP